MTGQVETKARCRPRNAKDPEGTKENKCAYIREGETIHASY